MRFGLAARGWHRLLLMGIILLAAGKDARADSMEVIDWECTISVGAVRCTLDLRECKNYVGDTQNLRFELCSPPSRGFLEYQSDTNWVTIANNVKLDSFVWYYTVAGLSTGIVSFTWRMSDGVSTSDPATMTITLTDNEAPVANAQSVDLFANSVRNGLFPSVNHSDYYQPMEYIITDLPTNGVLQYLDGANYVTISQNTWVTQDLWWYTPAKDYIGGDSIKWRVSDGLTTSSVATCALNIKGNSAPTASVFRALCKTNGSVTKKASFTDADLKQVWTAVVVSQAAHGSVSTNGDNLVYTPNTGFTGVDSFIFMVNDGYTNSNVATGYVCVRDYGQAVGMLVDIVVNDLLYSVLSNEVNRLKADLDADGYTASITPLSSGASAQSLWMHLNSLYQTNFLVGALLIGNVAMCAPGGYYSDSYYWDMSQFQTSPRNVRVHDIWVGRFYGPDGLYGSEVEMIRNALDANHYYRTGQSRLPHSAYVYIGSDNSPNPGMRQASATQCVNVATQVWKNAYVGFNAYGSDLMCEDQHGGTGCYGGNNIFDGAYMDMDLVHRGAIQSRAMLCTSCVSGCPDGVVNHQLLSRGGGNIFSVGASTLCGINSYNIFMEQGSGDQAARFRSLLAAGETWGQAMLQYYPFGDGDFLSGGKLFGYANTMIYGDLSMKPLATPSNNVPSVTAVTASATMATIGQPVTFTAAISDPDGNGEKSPHLPFRHQIEWFMNGYNYGKNAPTYTTDTTQGSGWTNITHAFAAAGTYTIRAEVMDEWRARGWHEMTVTVADPAASALIIGRVTRSDTKADMPGVTINFSDVGSTTSAGDGTYTMPVPLGWAGNASAYYRSGGFAKPVLTFKAVTKNQTNKNFVWSPDPVIQGVVTRSDNSKVGVEGVIITFSNVAGIAITSTNGSYTKVVPYDWSGLATASFTNGGFAKPIQTYKNVVKDQPKRNYVWTPDPVIQGVVTRSDNSKVGVEGVIITFSNVAGIAITSTNGSYTKVVPYGWSGLATASFTNGGFAKSIQTYKNVVKDQPKRNYVWTPDPVISGTVMRSDKTADTNVTIMADHNGGVTRTDGSGNYRLTVPYNWSGAVTPSEAGGTFNPASKSFSLLKKNVSNVKFVRIAPAPGISRQSNQDVTMINDPHSFAQWAIDHGLFGNQADLFDQDVDGDDISNGAEYTFGSNLLEGERLVRLLTNNARLTAEVPLQDPATLIDAKAQVEFTLDPSTGFWFPAICLPPQAATPATKQWFQAGHGEAVDFRVKVELVK